ncbi:hypothetical protein KUH03_08430 [Sphingobacterium sp. E70]|uniref:hypothetical protein n=1 Tax=Sphingobacterium sp. E70 TaxID=2853439 RepID=UPI00211C506A|nr:hypothetical protein [Sphingobacterium sp. E70]ULT26838.1 hypothetical protein KUH03_08430 [Sphingobacterium sp. E70]
MEGDACLYPPQNAHRDETNHCATDIRPLPGICQWLCSKNNAKRKNASLELIINKIRKQSGYDFIGDAQLIKKSKGST